MKKIVLFLCFLTIQFGNSQNINFTDLNFKSTLLEFYPNLDADSDGEISQSEALTLQNIDTYYREINNLTGIEFFTNLKSYSSFYFKATSFNFPTLVNLEEIYLLNAITGIGSLTSLNLESNINLKKVTLSVNTSTLDLGNLTNLKYLSVGGNFTQINLSQCTNLLDLSITAPLTSLNLSNNIKLINLNLTDGFVSNLDLSNNLSLEIVNIPGNKIITLDLGQIKHVKYLFVQDNELTNLNTNNLFNLQNLNCDNNFLITLSIKNDGLIFGDNSGVTFLGNPSLQSICCDENEIVYMQNLCNLYSYSTIVSACIPPPVEARPLTMFPNPVKDMLYLDTTDKINKVEVFSSNGLLIMSSEAETDIIDMQSITNGMYFLKVYRDNSVDDMKFIKG